MKDITELAFEELALKSSDISALMPKVIAAQVEEAARAKRYARQLVRVNRDLITKGSKTLTVGKRGSLTAIAIGEGSTMTHAPVSYDTVSITASKIGLGVGITQEAIDSKARDLIQDEIIEAGEAMADKEDTDVLGVFLTGSAAYTNTQSAGTLNHADIISARNAVRGQKWNPNVMVIHPDQESDLLQNSKFIDASQYGDREPIYNGEIGKIAGLKVLVTTNMTSGKVLVVDTERAATLAIARDIDLKRKEAPESDSIELYFYQEYGCKLVNLTAARVIMSA